MIAHFLAVRFATGLAACAFCKDFTSRPWSDLHVCLVSKHLSCRPLYSQRLLATSTTINLLATLEKECHHCSTPSGLQYMVCTSFVFMILLYSKTTAGFVILFTVICLAMAGHFQSVLATSDLSECPLILFRKSCLISTASPAARFVPFAIFVCSASMFIILVLLVDLFFTYIHRLIFNQLGLQFFPSG